MSKTPDPVNYILTGNRFQVVNEDGTTSAEYGVGMFRSGIRLDLAIKLYVELVTSPSSFVFGGEEKRLARARELAATAFNLSEVFLDEMDKHYRRPAPTGNNNS